MSSSPTVSSRLRRRFILASSDRTLAERARSAVPDGWEMIVVTDLAEVGGFEEILQHRFLLLDLDDDSFDPLEMVTALRTEMMLNIAIVTLGGSPALRDQARLARADRSFDRGAAIEVMQQFCRQYGW